MSLTHIGNLQLARELPIMRLDDATQDTDQVVEDFLSEAGADNVKVYEGRTHIAGAKVEFKVFEPDEVDDIVPIHIRNGFFGAGPAYFGLGAALAKQGRRAVVTECVRSQLGVGALMPNVFRLQSQAGYAAIRATAALFGTPQADILAHSMGGPTTTLLALRHPEVVRSISYTGPAGQDGRNSLGYRVQSLGLVAKHEVLPNAEKLRGEYDPERSMVLDAISYGSRIVRTAREAIAAAIVDDRPKVATLRRIGIPVGLVAMGQDRFFSPDNLQQYMHRDGSSLYEAVSIIEDGMHIDPNINPESHAQVQLEMFRKLDQVAQLRSVS